MFTLAISCLTTSNLPWFVDLTFHVPMQYCSLQHRALLPSLVTPPAGRCFHFGSISSFFLELFLHSSPVAYWAPTDLGSSSFSVISFCLFILFMGLKNRTNVIHSIDESQKLYIEWRKLVLKDYILHDFTLWLSQKDKVIMMENWSFVRS